MTAASAQYMDGQRAVSRSVRLDYASTTLVIRDADSDQEIDRWEARDIRGEHSQNFTDPVMHLHHLRRDGAFITAPAAAIPEALARALNRTPAQKLRSRAHGRQLGYALALLLLLVPVIYLSLPSISRRIAHQFPLEWERKASESLLSIVTSSFKIRSTPEAEAAIARLAQRLRPPAGQPGANLDYRILLLDEKSANAFALLGGGILIHCGLVRDADSSDELAGVLAHEMQHVIHRHALAGLIRAGFATVVGSLALGDYSGVLVVDPQLFYQILSLRFSRSDEAEADRDAVGMLDRAGIGRAGMIAFFTRVAGKEARFLQFVSTHPASAERARWISDARPSPSALQPAMPPADWEALRAACADSR